MSELHIVDLYPVAESYQGRYPWTQIGVFPVDAVEAMYQWFNYTVGLGPEELWASCVSIEHRAAGNALTGGVLNVLAAAWVGHRITYGDSVVVPLGVPDGPDADSIWWIAAEPEPARLRQCNVGRPSWCVPILWSSPLGWADG